MKPIGIHVQHVHTDLGKNVDCEPLEELDGSSGFVYRCSQCKTEIVLLFKEEEGEQ